MDDLKAKIRQQPEVRKQAEALGAAVNDTMDMEWFVFGRLDLATDETTPWGRACLLEALREAADNPHLVVYFNDWSDGTQEWVVVDYGAALPAWSSAPTEGEAILAAWASLL